jgi:DNA invertase Pin-like site-specific DNA recombinase
MLSGDEYLRWFLARNPIEKMMDRYLVQSHRERTKQGLKRAKDNGVQLGAPVLLATDTATLITRYRADGMTFAEIATALNSESVTTPTGKPWAANNVADTLRRNGGDPAPRRRGPRVAAKVPR